MSLEEKETTIQQDRTTKKIKKQVNSSSKNSSNKFDEFTNEYRDKILSVFQKQKKYSLELRKTDVLQRVQKLKKLKDIIEIRADDIRKALYEDFKKAGQETDITEILPVLQEINEVLRNISGWMNMKSVDSPLTLFGTKSEIQYQPKGVCLIISPWNYPFQLAITPLISAIAAGNAVILKPSEFTPATSEIMKRILETVFVEEEVSLFMGDYKVSEFLTELPFDHIFFTGSTQVGKIVMQKAAANLVSVTLELGGKTPVIIDESSDVRIAAERILWGKVLNAGQTCVAPDYTFIHKKQVDKFVQAMKDSLNGFYETNRKNLIDNPDFCRIINKRNHKRLVDLVQNALDQGAKLEMGGDYDSESLFFYPTLLSNVPLEADILQEEIFGPILPLVVYESLDDPITHINSRPKPLALYIFSNDSKNIDFILQSTSSGGVAINDVIIHLANSHLPFGGVNHSGMGSYHGIYGFKAFSHERAILRQGLLSTVRLLYPPYSPVVDKVSEFMKNFMI
jgi:aldehyde dehydrogenase (NAD+)